MLFLRISLNKVAWQRLYLKFCTENNISTERHSAEGVYERLNSVRQALSLSIASTLCPPEGYANCYQSMKSLPISETDTPLTNCRTTLSCLKTASARLRYTEHSQIIAALLLSNSYIPHTSPRTVLYADCRGRHELTKYKRRTFENWRYSA